MDLQKLIETQAVLAPERRSPREERAVGVDAVNRPIELQEAQAERVRSRIENLEKSKAALIQSIDAELAELKSEHEARTRRIAAGRKNMEAAAKAAADASGTKTKKVSEAAAKEVAADPKDKKTRAAAAKEAKEE